MAGKVRKKLSYRDISGKTAEEVALAWKDFTWQSGPYVCIYEGPWGQVQVWASSVEEGIRVCQYALTVGGWSQHIDKGQFRQARTMSPRYGVEKNMRLLVGGGLVGVSKREGPSGTPLYPDDSIL